jgi:hypothetical protein
MIDFIEMRKRDITREEIVSILNNRSSYFEQNEDLFTCWALASEENSFRWPIAFLKMLILK